MGHTSVSRTLFLPSNPFHLSALFEWCLLGVCMLRVVHLGFFSSGVGGIMVRNSPHVVQQRTADSQPAVPASACFRAAKALPTRVPPAVSWRSRPPPLPLLNSHQLEPVHDTDEDEAASLPRNHSRNDGELVAAEHSYRRCCTTAWRESSRVRTIDYCEEEAPQWQPMEDGKDRGPSRLTCINPPGDMGDASSSVAWYCQAHELVVNSSAISVGALELATPTAAIHGLLRPRALLLSCKLRWRALQKPKRFGMLMRHLLPSALGEISPGWRDTSAPAQKGRIDELADGQANHGDGSDAPSERVVVFVTRYSVKNFFLAHFDLLQVAAILSHALGPDFSERVQLVMLPPDKSNRGWWGPQAQLWSSFSDLPAISYATWIKQQRQRRHQQRLHGQSESSGSGALLLPVRHAILALSGYHSVYGRGVIGRQMEAICDGRCVAGKGVAARLQRVSAFYRQFVNLALERAGLLYLPSPYALATQRPGGNRGDGRREGLWISRGKGLGRGYGQTVGRRCLNEKELLASLAVSNVSLRLTALELADVSFAVQIAHFRNAAVLTGMHGAGYANLIFLPPGAVVAELCPLGYCTPSYERLSQRLALVYMRWTNTHPHNAKAGYDTIVDVGEFHNLMHRAVQALVLAGHTRHGTDL